MCLFKMHIHRIQDKRDVYAKEEDRI